MKKKNVEEEDVEEEDVEEEDVEEEDVEEEAYNLVFEEDKEDAVDNLTNML